MRPWAHWRTRIEVFVGRTWRLARLVAACASTMAALLLLPPAPGLAQNNGPLEQDSEQEPPSVSLAPDADCLAKAGHWSEPEQWAWTQLCARERIDFDKRYGTKTGAKDVQKLKSDARRRLSALFLRQLFEEPRYAAIVQKMAVHIVAAYIPDLSLRDAAIGTLRISNSAIDNVHFSWLKGEQINFSNTTIDTFYATQLSLSRLSFVTADIGKLDVLISRFSGQFAILHGQVKSLRLDESKSDGLYIRPASAGAIQINNYVDTGVFFLEVRKWTDASSLSIHTVTSGRFFLRGKMAAKASIEGFSFPNADWGSHPLGSLNALMTALGEPNPGLYTRLAASYSEAGQADVARDILIARQNAEFAHSNDVLEKSYLFMAWLLADYGYRPENGLLWIAGFVVVAAFIFRSGRHRVAAGEQPGNWLVFAFDNVIPGIKLDARHSDLQFAGWRQYFLYFLRFLSAVVVVVVIEMLKKSLSGLG